MEVVDVIDSVVKEITVKVGFFPTDSHENLKLNVWVWEIPRCP